jgi:hypothetical protein
MVVAVAIVEFVGSSASLLVSIIFLMSELERYIGSNRLVRIYGPGSAFHPYSLMVYLVFILVPMTIGLLGIASSIGLFRLRRWARQMSVNIAMYSAISCALLVVFRPGAVFPREPGNGAILVVGGGVYLLFFQCLTVVLIPIAIWWRASLNRVSISSLFH